jgi:hypothetical protein
MSQTSQLFSEKKKVTSEYRNSGRQIGMQGKKISSPCFWFEETPKPLRGQLSAEDMSRLEGILNDALAVKDVGARPRRQSKNHSIRQAN